MKKSLSKLKKSKKLEQEKLKMNKTAVAQITKNHTASNKYHSILVVAAVVWVAATIPYSFYLVAWIDQEYEFQDLGSMKSDYIIQTLKGYAMTTLVDQEYEFQDLGSMKSGYTIQNLKGDTIDTWLSWRLTEGDTLHVAIVNAHKYPEKVEIIKDVILSTEAIEIDDFSHHLGSKELTSLYYLGWTGALEKSSQTPTVFYIPKKLEVLESTSGAGDIIIRLTNERNGDGLIGWTKSIADESQNQILKSEITIYDADNLTDYQLASIVRHEFGHAIGLAHSTDPKDLMSVIGITEFPYISDCDIDALVSLYDGGKKSQVVCEK